MERSSGWRVGGSQNSWEPPHLHHRTHPSCRRRIERVLGKGIGRSKRLAAGYIKLCLDWHAASPSFSHPLIWVQPSTAQMEVVCSVYTRKRSPRQRLRSTRYAGQVNSFRETCFQSTVLRLYDNRERSHAIGTRGATTQ